MLISAYLNTLKTVARSYKMGKDGSLPEIDYLGGVEFSAVMAKQAAFLVDFLCVILCYRVKRSMGY